MSTHEKYDIKKRLNAYITGFVLSLITTLIAYWIVITHANGGLVMFSHTGLYSMLGVLAVVQFIVQAVYFLHLGTESKPRWRVVMFWYMILMVLIIVVGSIWIMENLNYNMMNNSDDAQRYIEKSQGF